MLSKKWLFLRQTLNGINQSIDQFVFVAVLYIFVPVFWNQFMGSIELGQYKLIRCWDKNNNTDINTHTHTHTQ
jgi:hypothetical protein